MKEPELELQPRCCQAAAAFFCSRSSKCAKRSEPWLFGQGQTGVTHTATEHRENCKWNDSPKLIKNKF